MDRTKQTMIATIVAVAMMMGWLLAGCTKEGTTAGVQLFLDGAKMNEEMPVHFDDGRLMVSENYIETVFNKKVEWLTQKREDGAAYYSNQVAVLMYHDMAPSPKSDGIIAADRFERQMQLLKDNEFQVISMEQYTSFMLEDATVPNNAVLITFDDGYESFYTYAYPILKKFGYPAVNFVIVSSIDNRKEPGTPKLTWEQMREMKAEGMSFRNHTYDQHRYGAVNKEGDELPVTVRLRYDIKKDKLETNEQYGKRIAEDLKKAEDRLRTELGNTQSALAFPYGVFNDALIKLTDAAGIAITFNTREGINSKFHRNGYRVNGAQRGETEDQLIERLKHLGSDGNQAELLFIDGREAMGISYVNEPIGQGKMIGLRDFCEFAGWSLHWNNAKKQVQIKTQQGA
ncbi:polysaccharide deacetylase family protein [Paenibacillus paridis]|uniref:polysaccharide deacetylase family protein n=1 Tax=Paenibacillus paridis TaxID=2583376 RepID=UPI001122FF22|nr:polysaccharide deacetylase family protein [Paenibacillus paridis]